MDTDVELKEFVGAIRKSLPEESARVDELLRGRGYVLEDMECLWVETMADVTNMYIHRREEKRLENQFLFFSGQYDRGSAVVKECIDVSYVENLMWDLPAKDKKWAWPMIPGNLQGLYINMWGVPHFS